MYRKRRLCLLISAALGLSGCSLGMFKDQPDTDTSAQAEAAPDTMATPGVEPGTMVLPAAGAMGSKGGVVVKPGQCWVYAPIQPKPVSDRVEVVLKDSTTKLQVTPAEFRDGYKQVVTKEGTLTYKVEPATYKKITEQVEVRPESSRIVVEPAVYDETEIKVTVEEAQTVVTPCPTSGTKYATGVATLGVCTVEQPAKTKMLKVQKLVTPERSRVEIIPAKYKEITRWVVDKPAEVIQIEVNDDLGSLPVEELVSTPKAEQVFIPAVKEDVGVVRYEGAPEVVVRQAVCDGDIDRELILSVQGYLQQAGFQPGRMDGLLGPRTIDALQQYQVQNGLASGALTFETLAAMGLSNGIAMQ